MKRASILRIFILISILAVSLLNFAPGNTTRVIADSDDALTIRVGYLGDDYEVVKTFSESELRALGTSWQSFTYYNRASSYGLDYDNPVLQVEDGVSLDAVIRAAGIDTGSIQRYYFKSRDGFNGYSDFTSAFISSPRYYYPHLTDKLYWTGFEYTVTFVDWNGYILKEEKVAHGKSAVPPEDPIREGYTFSGWSGDYSKVTQDVTIKAKYIENPVQSALSSLSVVAHKGNNNLLTAAKSSVPKPGPDIGEGANKVRTAIALCEKTEVWGTDPSALKKEASSVDSLRLCFGMTDPYDRSSGGSYDSIKWITGIAVMLVGTAPDKPDTDGKSDDAELIGAGKVDTSAGENTKNKENEKIATVDKTKEKSESVQKINESAIAVKTKLNGEVIPMRRMFEISMDSVSFTPEKHEPAYIPIVISSVFLLAFAIGVLQMTVFYRRRKI